MSVFKIRLGETPIEVEGDVVLVGSISIGDFSETFHASLSYWNMGQYVSQWRNALQRVLCGESKSAVVTSMYDPSLATFIVWWVIYVIGSHVHIQNHILFLDDIETSFDESDMYSLVRERETRTEDDGLISEWVTNVSAIRACLTEDAWDVVTRGATI